MARKKGGKKGKHDRDQSVAEIPQSGEDQAQPEVISPVPVGETARLDNFDEPKEPALADAVSEVLGDQKTDRKEKKFNKKFKTHLAKFSADGYDVAPLEALLETASTSELKDALTSFEAGIGKTKFIKDELLQMDLVGLDKEVEELNQLLASPLQHEAASTKFASLKFRRRANEISSALSKMVLPSMKPKAEALKAKLETSSNLEAIEIEFSDLKREYKEAYAEDGLKAQMVMVEPDQPTTEAPKSRTPMTVKDIFLLYKDGRFISHHTNRVVSKEQQKELFADLKTGRNFLRSPKYVPQKLNVIPIENRHILVQSGRFTVVIVITEGSVDPWSEKIVTKVITLMEKEDQMQLKAWNGDVMSLKSSGKYMQALLFAFMKLSNKGK
jgi:hypothetical protein